MKKKRTKSGMSPGSVVYTGKRGVEKVFIHTSSYNGDKIEETLQNNKEKIVLEMPEKGIIKWIDIRGVHDAELIELVGKQFNVHGLILEDIANIEQRPKYDEFENGNFFVMKALSFNHDTLQIESEQVSIFFRDGLIISFQEAETDLFSSVRDRLKMSNGRIRQRGTDYLTYALIDTLVDNYYQLLDDIEINIDLLEERIIHNPDKTIKTNIHHLKKELLVSRKSIGPLREAISRFSKSDSEFINEESKMFIRDLYDHTVQVLDMVESYRDTINGLQDLYLSEISYKMNQVMQILTIISVIFVPLTFLAGIYGMNFDVLPELHWTYGYLYFWLFSGCILVLLLWYFKRKKWL
ncbi:MAG: magnesium/cobalt transporter CorA [Crocinitomicaceae bacterium]